MRRVSFERPSRSELRGRARSGARARRQAVRTAALPVVQCAVAAPLSWLVATHVVGRSQAFFAPIAADHLFGGRPRRAAATRARAHARHRRGDPRRQLLVYGIGVGTWQIGVVVALGMTAALLLGGGSSGLLVTQAAVAGVLVVTIQPPPTGRTSPASSTRSSAADSACS